MPGPYLLVSTFLPTSLARHLFRKVWSLYISAITALVQPLVDSYLDYRNSPWIDFSVSWISFPVGTCFHCHQSNLYKITLDFAILFLKKPLIADSSELPIWGSNVWASCIQGLSWSAPWLIHYPSLYIPTSFFSSQIWIFYIPWTCYAISDLHIFALTVSSA